MWVCLAIIVSAVVALILAGGAFVVGLICGASVSEPQPVE